MDAGLSGLCPRHYFTRDSEARRNPGPWPVPGRPEREPRRPPPRARLSTDGCFSRAGSRTQAPLCDQPDPSITHGVFRAADVPGMREGTTWRVGLGSPRAASQTAGPEGPQAAPCVAILMLTA